MRLVWRPKAQRYLEKLPSIESERIIAKFIEIAKEPFRYTKQFNGPYYKIRIGDYRALVGIEKNIIDVFEFGRRGNIY